jgi:HTH-type transcriptional regulator / antitoxin HigA
MPASDPVEAIRFLMDQKNLTRDDLEVFLGPKSRVSDVLNRKRSLTMSQIVKLHKGLDIPYESLIEEKRYI